MPTYYAPTKRIKRKGGKLYTNRTYVVRGRINGKEHEIYTASTKKKGAGGAEEEWENYKLRIWSERDAVPTPETATFRDAVMMYREATNLSPREGHHVAKLEAYFGDTLISDIRPQSLIGAAHAIYPGRRPQTKNRQAIRPAAAIIHHLAKNDLCNWIRTEQLTEDDPFKPTAFPDEVEILIRAARKQGDHELAALLETLAYQGWRITETIEVERANIDFQKARIQRWVSKSRRWRWVSVDREVCAAWAALPKNPDGRLFTYKERKAVYKAIDALGFPKKYRPHMSRRGFATELKNQGHDLLDIAEAGGWEDVKSVARYVQADLNRTRRTLSSLRGNSRGKRKKAS
ncbi:MAG: tyrosine-type recombinase/integrase [Alphaproteobacteria bacterium]|nr:tyrosine-type recombinase/integrase [Alphaproteobacteria bacterium]